MSDRALRSAMAVLALAGAAIATYLLSVRWSGSAIACTTGGCETVQNSEYSKVFGVPVAALGLLGYLAILGTALGKGDTAKMLGAVLGLGAVAFGAYLLYVQISVIDAVCDWCLASDAVTTALAGLALLRLRSTR